MIVVNYFLASLFWIISIMPFFILHGISDFFFVIIFYLVRYRKKVVFENLKKSFPEKSEKEIRKIAIKYYHNLCDIFIEVIKAKTISLEGMLRRYHYKNTEIIDQLYNEGRSIIALCSHIGNWEWLGMSMNSFLKHKSYAIVKPLTDKFWDSYMSKTRLRFPKEGLVQSKYIFRELVKTKDIRTLTLIAGDQTPTKNEIEYWSNFLNQDTPFFLGSEKIAKSLNMAVVFVNIQRIKRSRYEIEFSLLTKDPRNTAEFEITEMYIKKLEQVICEHNDNWLWSHRRWKHKRAK